MLISVEHVTRYRYASEARYCVQSLRLTPASFAGHRVLDWQVSVEPAGTMTSTQDGFGNAIQLATVTVPHDEIVISATGTIDVEDRNGVVQGLPDGIPSRIFLRRTTLTEPDAAILDLADDTRSLDPVPRLHALMGSIRDRVGYEVGMTGARTTAAEALAAGVGVCQDHAHIFIAASRASGIPARYVTGYLVLDESQPADAHHAWAEAWIEGLGWVGFDVANRICPTDRYVRLATALDAHYAAPVRGSRRGDAAESLDVSVNVRQETAQQTQTQQ